MESSIPVIKPTPALGTDIEPLSAEQVKLWREQGCILIEGIFPDTLIQKVKQKTNSSEPSIDYASSINAFASK